MSNAQEDILVLVRQGHIEQVFQNLTNFRGEKGDNYEVVLLQSQYNKVKRDKNLGLIANNEYQKAINRLTYAILNIVDSIDWPSKSAEKGTSNAVNYTIPADAKRLKVAYSYARGDQNYFEELTQYLKPLERSGKIETWHDGQIRAGASWDNSIKEQLNKAEIFIFLISADYLSTDYIWREEMAIAMECYEKDKAIIIPIIVRPCMWHETPFSKFAAVPFDRQGRNAPVSRWDDHEDAWGIVAKEIEKLVHEKIKRMQK